MELLLMDRTFKSIGIIDAYTSLIWADRYNKYGDFEILLSDQMAIADRIDVDYYLWCKESEHSMIIEDISITTDVEEGDKLLVTGKSLESILERRIIWQQTRLTGNFQNAIKKLINDAIIYPSIVDRKINNFIFEMSEDPNITNLIIDTQFTGTNLYEAISGLCQMYNIGFKVILNDNNDFVFSLYKGKDRSYDQLDNPYVIFSPDFENIINSNYFMSFANFKTMTLVAGEGEGASRRTTTIGWDSFKGIDRRELFVDARDISSDTEHGTLSNAEYTEQLKGRGLETMAEYDTTQAFEGEVESTRLFKYGEDFFMGDIIQILNKYGKGGHAYISEFIFAQTEEGFSAYPTFQLIQ